MEIVTVPLVLPGLIEAPEEREREPPTVVPSPAAITTLPPVCVEADPALIETSPPLAPWPADKLRSPPVPFTAVESPLAAVTLPPEPAAATPTERTISPVDAEGLSPVVIWMLPLFEAPELPVEMVISPELETWSEVDKTALVEAVWMDVTKQTVGNMVSKSYTGNRSNRGNTT